MKHFLQTFRSLAATALLAIATLAAQAETITLTKNTVGNTDNSSGWGEALSEAVEIPTGKTTTFEFDNYSSKANVWNNWAVCLQNDNAGAINDDVTYFCLRSDAYGWDGKISGYDYVVKNISTNYAGQTGESVWGDIFKADMDGAHVYVAISRETAGTVTVKAIAEKGSRLYAMTYNQTVDASKELYAFLIADNSHFENLKAYRDNCGDISSIWVNTNSAVVHYFAPSATTTPLIKAAVTVGATLASGAKTLLSSKEFTFSDVDANGKFTASYSGKTANGSASISKNSTTLLGATDLSTAFNTVFSKFVQVKKGQTATCEFQLRSDNAANWHCPTANVTTNGGADSYFFRPDNWAWCGESNSGSDASKFGTLTSNWNWDKFSDNLDGSFYTISVTNNGGTVDVRFDLTDGAGESHFQYFRWRPGIQPVGRGRHLFRPHVRKIVLTHHEKRLDRTSARPQITRHQRGRRRNRGERSRQLRSLRAQRPESSTHRFGQGRLRGPRWRRGAESNRQVTTKQNSKKEVHFSTPRAAGCQTRAACRPSCYTEKQCFTY